MTNNEKKKGKYPERLALKNTKAARSTLCRLIRLRFQDAINKETYRDLIYGLNSLLTYDKQITECEIETRLERLEAHFEKTGNS